MKTTLVTPPIVNELATFVHQLPPMATWKRVRIAVTPAEWNEMREFFLADRKQFFNTIGMIPMVIEERPTEPEVTFEIRT